MTIACKVEDYMAQRGIKYDVVTHEHSRNSIETAHLAHVPGDRLAKSVVLEDDDGFVMAVLPSTCHIKLGRLSRHLIGNFVWRPRAIYPPFSGTVSWGPSQRSGRRTGC